MLKHIRSTTWEEVFEDWRSNEGKDPAWIRFAMEDKGWDSWESWRGFTAKQINASTREWNLFEFTNPMNEIPNMLVGPFTGWQSRLPAPNQHTFADLVRIPEQESFFRAHEKVVFMMKDFLPSAMFIGLHMAGNKESILSDRTKLIQGDKVVCIEGHHRATAVALAALDGKQIDFDGSVHIALATLKADETQLLDRILARGTVK